MTTKLSHKDADFYDGPLSQHSVISEGAPHANSSKGPWAPTFWWNNTSSAQDWNSLMVHTLHYYPVQDDSKLRVVTCYRPTEVDKKDLAAFGHIYSWEDQAKYFLPWTAEKPILTTGHKPQTDGIVINGPEEIQKYSKFSPTMTNINVPIRPMSIYGDIANNDFGKKIHEAATAEHLFRKYLISERPNYVSGIGYVPFTDRTMEWRDALLSEGYNEQRELKGIGAIDSPRRHIHGVTINRRYIALSNKLVSEAWQHAYAHGYKGKAAQEFVDKYIQNVIEHETAHLYEEEGLPENVSEFNIRSMHGRVNAKRAASRHGTLQGRIYDILSRHWYATAEEFHSGKAMVMSRLEAIAEEAVKEAEEMGLKGEEATAYVNNRISEYTKNNDSEKSDSEKSKLEDTIDKSAANGETNPDDADSNYATNKAEASDNAPEATNDNEPAQESQAA
ncbi:hypothetical protein HYU50_01945 [Candidatus Woesearchaeota archaeon]|nr:hypothetical protein [Candidatus Woesearchaeota archaeon]